MKRPNILLLHTDQLRFDAIGANGNQIIKTPNLDKLTISSVNFTHCFAQNPVCMPSRISMMTGQYCSALRITHMSVTVPENTITMQKILHGYGYTTALIGKLHYLPHSMRDHRWPHPAYDFDHMELSDEPGCYSDAYRSFVARRDPAQLDKISLGLPPATEMWHRIIGDSEKLNHPPREIEKAYHFPGRSDCTHTAFVGEQTIEYLQQQQKDGRPFFCFSGFYSPHSPLVAPKEYFELYDEVKMPLPAFTSELNAKRSDSYFSDSEIRKATVGYYAMVSEVDHWIGRILDTLEKKGIADNTIVVFTSDHGEWLGEHLLYGKGHWAPDVISRVPMIIHVPRSLGGKSEKRDDIVECVDILPTLLSLAAIPKVPSIQGRCLAVASGITEEEGDGIALTEYKNWRSMRTESYRYVVHTDGQEMLFDLLRDPWEYNNIAGTPRGDEICCEARLRLIRRMLCIENPIERDAAY